jgi:hypothetical protein
MPNRRVHQAIGAAAGAGYAACRVRSENASHDWAEVLGGTFGGILGGAMPDQIDPPVNPRHRSLGHGVIPSVAVVKLYYGRLDHIQARLRGNADEHTARAKSIENRGARFIHHVLSLIFRLLAGAAAGLLAGYVSHLALDALTPSGLPLFA